MKAARNKLHAENQNLVPVALAMRFKRRFLEKDGQPCANNNLCGQGRNIALNSKLLLQIVTDEAASLFHDNELWQDRSGLPTRLVLPVILVPVIFGMIAVLLGVIFYFRWRAAHPLPEPDSVRSVVGDGEGDPSSVSRSSPSSGPPTWEKPGDWWKPDSGDGDETAG